MIVFFDEGTVEVDRSRITFASSPEASRVVLRALRGPHVDDGTPETVDNYARDITAFLSWTADPRLEERKWIGLMVMGYLLITAILMFFAYKRTWKAVH